MSFLLAKTSYAVKEILMSMLRLDSEKLRMIGKIFKTFVKKYIFLESFINFHISSPNKLIIFQKKNFLSKE